MYSACLFCNRHLGRNSSLASFPVGECLAFDARRGRLWVVCPHCRRWNLSPLEERWEAVEECERLFRGARLRVSGENVGLALLPEGLELIRIGSALRTEIAAWRYGRRLAPAAGPGGGRVPGGVAGAVRSLLGALPAGGSPAELALWLRLRSDPERVLDAVELPGGDRALVRNRHLESAELIRPETSRPWRLAVEHERGRLELAGRAGLSLVGKLLAVVNRPFARGPEIRAAMQKLEHAADPQSYFSRVAVLVLRTSWGLDPDAPRQPSVTLEASSAAERLALYLTCRSFWARGGTGSAVRTPLLGLAPVDRLALEMATHEESERRAMQGELAELEAAWREAEEIAEIADQLLRGRGPDPLPRPRPPPSFLPRPRLASNLLG
jgi:hypothetical protein